MKAAAYWRSGIEGSLLLAALSLTLLYLQQSHPASITLFWIAAVTLLLLAVRQIPVAWPHERSLTLAAPVVFATLVWAGAGIAPIAALLACLLQSRFWPSSGSTRREMRLQGAMLALAALAGGLTMDFVTTLLRSALPTTLLPAVRLLLPTGLSALAFGLVHALLSWCLFRYEWQEEGVYGTHLRRAADREIALLTLGIVPVVLLSPLHAKLGSAALLPYGAFLLLCAQVVRLRLEVAGLRGQLQTAAAMGRVSVTDEILEMEPAALHYRFLALAQGLIMADRALVWTLNDPSGELVPIVGLPEMGDFALEKALLGEGLIGLAATKARPLRIADASRHPCRGQLEPTSGAWLLYPIVMHRRVLGVAQWIRPANQPFTKEEAARLGALVPQAAVALENARIRAAMQELASTDGLTQLWNHRKMFELLRDEMQRAVRYHRALSVLMFDVDSFKSFNDTYGHPQGDQLLRRIADILKSSVRAVDYLGRYGGEEFIVLLPETHKNDAYRLAERIRAAVEEQGFVPIDGQDIRRTVSVGVASYPEDALNPAELVRCADEALYRAKHAGKNCVIWA